MIKSVLKLSDVIKRLNELARLDPDGMKALCEARADVGPKLASHDDLPVIAGSTDDGGGDTVYLAGPLGLINYLFGLDDATHMGPIAASFKVVCGTCGLTCSEASRRNGDEPVTTEQVVGGTCLACGGELELGDLIEFMVTDQGRKAWSK